MTHVVVRYDYRAPGADERARQELFTRSLEQARYVDGLAGIAALMVSEHHSADDGYLPSPLVAASALAGATRRLPITVSALLVNFYDPIRLAEDMAVLDHLSGGRVGYVLGLGYRPEEYALFDRDWQTRGADIEARIHVLLSAWTGEPFTHDGRRVRVTPRPASQPGPLMFYGGGSHAAARRAARLGLHFAPQVADQRLKASYEDACREAGREPGMTMMAPPGPAAVFCSEAPDAFWERHGHHLLADARAYSAWSDGLDSHVLDSSTTVEELRAAGRYLVLAPDELIARCRAGEIKLVTLHPACGGLPPEPSWETLRLVGERVLPQLVTE